MLIYLLWGPGDDRRLKKDQHDSRNVFINKRVQWIYITHLQRGIEDYICWETNQTNYKQNLMIKGFSFPLNSRFWKKVSHLQR